MELEKKKEKNLRITVLKKSLCIFMTVLMIISSFGGAMSVFAAEGLISDGDAPSQPFVSDADSDGLVTDGNVTIENITLGELKHVDVDYDESAWFRFIPEKDGNYIIKSFNNNDDPYGIIYDKNWNEIGRDDDDGSNSNFLITTYLYAGESYFLQARCYDYDNGSFDVIIKEGAKAVAFEPVKDFVLTEGISYGYYGTYGYYDESTGEWKSEEFYHFNIPYFRNGDRLIVTEADDTKNVYVFDEDRYTFISESGETTEVSCYSDQHENPWKPGDTDSFFTLEYQNLECKVSVSILPSPVESVSFTAAEDHIYTEGFSDGYYETEGYYDETLGEYVEDRYFIYEFSGFNDGDKITAKMKDGSVKEYIYSSEVSDEYEEDVFSSSDGEVVRPSVKTNPDSRYWVANGTDNKFTVNFAGAKCYVPVIFKANPVESVSFTPVSDFVFYKEVSDGYYDSDYDENEFYHYYVKFRNGDKLTVKRTDGSVTDYVYDSDKTSKYSGLFFDKNGTGIYVDIHSDQYSKPWVPGGEHNYFTVNYADKETQIPVTITEGEEDIIENISFVPAEEITLTEGLSDGYYDYSYFEDEDGETYSKYYYYYYFPELSPEDKISVTSSNGSVKDYYYVGNDDDIVFKAVTGETLRFDYESYQYLNPFEPDGDSNYFILQLKPVDDEDYDEEYIAEVSVPVTVLPSGIKSVSFESSNKFSVTENLSRGYLDIGFYYYYNPKLSLGDKLTVEKEDGTIDVYTYANVLSDDYEYSTFVNEKGEEIKYRYYNEQELHPWTVGGEYNFAYIMVGGKIAEIPVEVLPNPYVSFTLVNATVKTLLEGISDGYYEYCDECGKDFYYYYGPNFVPGDKIIAEKADGTKDEFVFSEKYYDFLSPEGEPVSVYINDNQYEEHWGVGKENIYTVKFGSLSAEYKVAVIENNIKSVSFNPVSDYEFIEGISNGYYSWREWEDENGEWYEERYYHYYLPDFINGDSVTVTFADGTVTRYTFDRYSYEFISDSGEKCYCSKSHNQSDNCWKPGGQHNYFILTVNGQEVKVPVTVREAQVDSVAFTPANEYVLAEKISDGYYSYNRTTDKNTGEIFYTPYYEYDIPYFNVGDKLTVKFTDGTVITAVYDDWNGNFVYDKGVLDNPETYSNQFKYPWTKGGNHNYFTLELAGKSCTVPVTIGDCAHSYINHEAKAPTCTEKGWAAYTTCKYCDLTTYKEIAATGHKYVSSVTKAATCTQNGTMLYKCSCGASYTVSISATGKHTPVTVKGTPATYKAEGKSDGSKCSVCGTVIKAQTTLAKLRLGKVSGLKAKKITLSKSSSVTLTWNKVNGAEKYEVYQQKGKKWVKIKTTSSTSLTVKKLKAGNTYKYKVRAVINGEKSGAYSSVLTVKMTPASTSLKLKAGKKQITASWNTVSGVTGYQVQYSTSKSFKKDTKTVTVKKAKTKKTTIKKLTKGKKYYVRVRAYQKIGSKTYYGAWTVKNVKSK